MSNYNNVHPKRDKDPLVRVLSLGGGVQSTTVCLMSDLGFFGDKPDYAIFADTNWEPPQVYENIEWLQKTVSFPIYVTDGGKNLKEDVLLSNRTPIPTFLKDSRGKLSMGMRQCTRNYKIRPLTKKIRELQGIKHKKHFPHNEWVELWMGISTDEITRVKPETTYRWISKRYPLIYDLRMSRNNCKQWLEENYPDRVIVKSACIGCPYRNKESWVDIKNIAPKEFEESIMIDREIRDSAEKYGFKSYLHRRGIPLDEAIKLDEKDLSILNSLPKQTVLDGFADECEGFCGV